jgi:UPF0755 protein
MLGTFRKRIIAAHAEEIKAGGKTLADIVTMASLIEKESRYDDERAMVSGILWKRFDAGTLLGVDATVRYRVSKKTEPLTKTDLLIDSAFNTRRIRGLPPSPITNPGESSIMAALQPKDSSYWYYLHGNDGVIRYAVTNDEHNVNKARYLR